MHDFMKLRVWEDSRVLAADIHRVARSFPKSDRQVVASQLRRAALSIPATIAEGCGKESRAEVVRYLQIAAGSASETASHLIIASDLGFITPDTASAFAERAAAIQRMLRALCRNLPPTASSAAGGRER